MAKTDFVIRLKDPRVIQARIELFTVFPIEKMYEALGLTKDLEQFKKYRIKLNPRKVDEAIYTVGMRFFDKLLEQALVEKRKMRLQNMQTEKNMAITKESIIASLRNEGYDKVAEQIETGELDTEKVIESIESGVANNAKRETRPIN